MVAVGGLWLLLPDSLLYSLKMRKHLISPRVISDEFQRMAVILVQPLLQKTEFL